MFGLAGLGVADHQLDGFVAVPLIPLKAVGNLGEVIHVDGLGIRVELNGPQGPVLFFGGG